MSGKKPAPAKKPSTKKAEGAEGETTEEVSTNPELLKLHEVAIGTEVDFAEVPVEALADDVEGLGAMMAGHAPLNEKGYNFVATFLGRRRVFSDKFKKTKKTLSYDGEEHQYRDILMFKDGQGREFGIWLTGELSRLTRLIPRNTIVKVTYLGESVIEGGDYDGEKQHDFSVLPERKALAEIEANKYQKGCLNWLNNPMQPNEKDASSRNMADLNNYIKDVVSGKVLASDAEKARLGIATTATIAGHIAQ